MITIEEFAQLVLDMRAKQIEYYKLMHRKRLHSKIDGEDLAKAYSEMRKAEQHIHEICLDIVGIDEDVDYGTI